MNSEHNAIGRHGVPGTQRLYGKCRDCGRMEKLSGFLCKYCYNARGRGYRYRTDPEYRRKMLERVAEYRKKRLVQKLHEFQRVSGLISTNQEWHTTHV